MPVGLAKHNTSGHFFQPSDMSGLAGWWDSSSLNAAGTTWNDKSGNGKNATITGTAWTTTTVTGNGSSYTIPVVYGLSTSQATFPAGSIPTNYTFLHVARYANYADHAKSGRIWTSTDGATGNWLSGFWYGGGSVGVSGVAYHNNWTVSPQTNLHSGNWVLSVDQPSLYRSNGVTRGTGAFGAGYPNGTGQLKINFNNFEISDFHIAEAIMYNRILTAAEYQRVENYLNAKYGIF